MEMHPVVSRQIASIGHDPETKTLHIRFADRVNKKTGETIPGALYAYDDVPAEVHGLLMAAHSHPDKSVGAAFGLHVRGGEYVYRKIEEKPAAGAPE